MKFLLILLFPLNLQAQNVIDNAVVKELSYKACLTGWYQNMLEDNDTRKEQVKLGQTFCEAFSQAVIKKLNEN